MRGAPLKAIQELLGHSTIQMTMRYAHLASELAREAMRLLDELPSSPPSGSRMAAGSETDLTAENVAEAHGNRTHQSDARATIHRF